MSELLCVDINESQNGQQIKEAVMAVCDLANVKNIVLKVNTFFDTLCIKRCEMYRILKTAVHANNFLRVYLKKC